MSNYYSWLGLREEILIRYDGTHNDGGLSRREIFISIFFFIRAFAAIFIHNVVPSDL